MVSTMAVRSRTHCASCAVASRAALIIEITSSSKVFMIRAAPQSVCEPRRPLERNATIGRLALQLRFLWASESMGNHDSKIVDAASVD
jgi:hypothetical protein